MPNNRIININGSAYPVPDVDEKTYHAQRGEYLTAHGLIDFLKSPYYYQAVRTGAIKRPESGAMSFGRLFHMAVLEPHVYGAKAKYNVPINAKTGAPYGRDTKAYEAACAEAEAVGCILVHPDDDALAMRMIDGIKRCEMAVDIITAAPMQQREITWRCDINGVRCQCRFDGVTDTGIIWDLKTCDDLQWFESDARKYGYGIQASFYRLCLAQLLGERTPEHIEYYLVACEKSDCATCRVYQFSTTQETQCDALVRDGIARYRQAVNDGKWSEDNELIKVIG